MFNIGGTELLLILFIAFVVVGPKDMPKIGRALGKGVRMLRSLINEVREESGFDEVDEAVKDIRRDILFGNNALKEIGRDVSRDLNKEMEEKR